MSRRPESPSRSPDRPAAAPLARLACLACLLPTLLVVSTLPADEPPAAPEPPRVAAASDEAEQAMAGFRLPEGIEVQLFAAEPLVANPVAFAIDRRGRFYVCESFRQNEGVTDNRQHDQRWLDRDLAARTVEDRLQYHRELLPRQAEDFTRQDDRLRLVEDRDGDGRADHATVFADRFNHILDGTGAGVLPLGGKVYYTCIPHLWLLRDTDGDGRANVRQSLHRGYGVRVAFRGHDLHGLIQGPDGRLYFSIGDRGYHVETPQGVVADPESGAVFRCNPDGSDLEVVATGLRNPQELAFDELGNLFTGDNNSDSGDRARWVYVVEGGDSGWRMAYQYLPDRGPFNRERLWHPYHEGQAAYIVPPVANLADGPSGLAYYPGTGLPAHFDRRFFLCDFRGGPANSGIRTFRVRPRGAFFEVADEEQTFWNILATDVAFAPGGALYVSDWVNGWNGEGKGRIYRFQPDDSAPNATVTAAAQATASLLSRDFDQLEAARLQQLLEHPDQRVRQQAQFALVARRATDRLQETAAAADKPLTARLHAVWGLGQLAREPNTPAETAKHLASLLRDEQPEVRAQAARVLGDARRLDLAGAVVELLADEAPRVAYFAAQAVGKLEAATALEPLFDLLARNDNADPILRHGAIMGLARLDHPEMPDRALAHPSAAVRLAAVVALRKQRNAAVSRFLNDSDPLVVLEAARAIHDVPLPSAERQLAMLIERPSDSEPLLRRVLHANYRLGDAGAAERLAAFAANRDAPESMRREALAMLGDWQQPAPRDRVLGMWRPLAPRDPAPAAESLRGALAGVLSGPDAVRQQALEVATKLGIREIVPSLLNVMQDRAAPGAERAAALTALATLQAEALDPLLDSALSDDSAALRAAARRVLATIHPDRALASLTEAVGSAEVVERQAALATLARMPQPEAAAAIAAALRNLIAGRIPADTQLDVWQAAQARKADDEISPLLARLEAQRPADDPLAPWRMCLEGGDAERGRRIFLERTQVSCVRCHAVQGRGGAVGPELTRIATDKSRSYLLEAIVAPSKTIAKGFETAVIADLDGKIHVGIVKQENERQVQLMTAEGRLVTLAQDDIEARRPGESAMPDDLVKHLSLEDLRDLVQYLSVLK